MPTRLETEKPVSHSALGRIPLYLRALSELDRQGLEYVSSARLGRWVGVPSCQVRRDLGWFGTYGRAGKGYPVAGLLRSLRSATDLIGPAQVILVGLRSLGRALLQDSGRGWQVVAIFETDPGLVGRHAAGLEVQHLADLERQMPWLSTRLAILALPAEEAPAAARLLARAGVRGILNYSSACLRPARRVRVREASSAWT